MPDERRPIRVVVADDEPIARATLEKLLGEDDEIELAAVCKNGAETVSAVREESPDLLFLDVHMPGLGGFEVIEELGDEKPPVVVFVTAYDAYALRAFDVQAVDYLLKPFDDDRFRSALERAKERVRRDAPEPVQRLSIHREGRIEVIDVRDVVWIEAADQYVKLHTASGVHLMRESMTQLERMLDPRRFLRVHRSVIVALDHIGAVDSSGGSGARVRIGQGTWLPVSRSRTARLRQRLR